MSADVRDIVVRLKTYCLAFAALFSTVFAAPVPSPVDRPPLSAQEIGQGYRDRMVLAKPRAMRRASVDAEETREGMRLRRRWDRFDGLRLLELREGETTTAGIARLRATGRYEYVQADSIRQALAVPNDPDFNRQWPLANNGANNGIVGVDIKATPAWDVRTDAGNVVVAVIDTGIHLGHPDLTGNLWVNAREIAGNGRDDDGNGYVDDVHGINAIANSGHPADDQGHGTHVAGIVGAVGHNGIGISGVAWRVQLMALKFLGAGKGRGLTSDAIECIDYAIRHGAQIINASYGAATGAVTQFEPAEYDAIARARDAGIIFVAAAGNDAADMDLLAHYPASFRLENVVGVANATGRDDAPVSTNFGSGSVELFAPGSEIYSTGHEPGRLYVTLSGTSMAAPHVAGALALLRAHFPADDYRQLINRILRNVDPVAGFNGRVQTGGRLNLDRALRSVDHRPFNDDFATRARVSGSNLAIRGVNAGATAEGEPAIAGQPAAATLWWEWTPKASATVRLTTEGSSYDTVLAVFTGDSLTTLTPVSENDNHDGKTSSRLEFPAEAGRRYQIVVGSKTGATGLTLLDVGAIPSNDNVAGAQVISGRAIAVQAENAQATLELQEPRIRGLAVGKSLWYRWTAPGNDRFQIALKSEGFDPVLAVYTAAAGSDAPSGPHQLAVVAASDDADTEAGGTEGHEDALVTIDATAGTTYWIQAAGKMVGNLPPTNAPFALTLNDTDWQGITGDSITNAPAIGPDGALYVGSTDGRFHAFNADGRRRWPAIDLNDAAQDTSAAALAPDGTLYFGSGPTAVGNDARLHAYHSATGEKKWDIVVGEGTNANNAVALGADGMIFVHSDEGRVFAYRDLGAAAQEKWSALVPGRSYASITIAPDGTLYLGCDDPDTGHRMFALNAVDGSTKWTALVEHPIYTATAIDAAGNIYFGTLSSGRLYSLTPEGSRRWMYTGARLGTSSSPALSPDGATVYFAAYDGLLHAVDTATGTARWTFRLGSEVRASSPAVDSDGVVYVGCYDHLLYAVNANGSLHRTWATGNIIRSSPAIAGTRLFFGSNDHGIYAVDIGATAAGPWPQYRHNARRTGRAVAERVIIAREPPSHSAVAGQAVELTVTAANPGPISYQWFKDGNALPGATQARLLLPAANVVNAGNYTVLLSTAEGATLSAPAAVTVRGSSEAARPGRLVNLSVRTAVGTGAETVIVGFQVAGAAEKPVLIRAIGPSLARFGVPDAASDPQLRLLAGANVLLENDDWGMTVTGGLGPVSGIFSATGAFPLEAGSRDAALVRSMTVGTYTAQISTTGATRGIALAELYDVAPDNAARLANVSARSQVNLGTGILIVGFTISGNVPKTVLVRGIGPGLATFGVTGNLLDPQLALYQASAVLARNDNWAGSNALQTAFGQVGAFTLPAGSADAAMVVTLTPGNYTVQLSGANSTTGVALIEVYELP